MDFTRFLGSPSELKSKVCWSSCHGYLLATIFCPLLQDLFLAAHVDRVGPAQPFIWEMIGWAPYNLVDMCSLVFFGGKRGVGCEKMLGKRRCSKSIILKCGLRLLEISLKVFMV